MKVVIYYGKLVIGGAERSTVELANGFHRDGHDVTMFVETKGGALDKDLSPEIKMMYFFHDTGALRSWNRNLTGLLTIGFRNLLDAAWQFFMGYLRKCYYTIKKPMFDYGIVSFNGFKANVLTRYTRCCVKAKIMRNDRAIFFNGVPYQGISDYVDEYNKKEVDFFVCVSKKMKKLMLEYCNIPPNRVYAIYNIKKPFDVSCIKVDTPEEYLVAKDKTKVVTVCRLLDATKGLLRMVEVASTLKERGLCFKWFIVGDGPDRDIFEAAIKAKNLNDIFVLCGFKKNPYNYYKYADIVAVLSYVEGFCGTVTEAKMLEKPLIVTDFSVREQIEHGVNGYIVENNKDAIVNGMENLLINEELRNSLAVNGLSQEILDNDYKIKQYEELYHHFRKEMA